MSFEVRQAKLDAGRGKFCSRQCPGKVTSVRHGGWNSAAYGSWAAMKQRCTNPNSAKFSRYGAAGISVDPRWNDFANFIADMGDRPEGTTLDRIDGTRDYGPGNCRWATPREQQGNLRNNRIVSYRGKEWVLSALACHVGVNRPTLEYRINQHWPEDEWAKGAWGGNRHQA